MLNWQEASTMKLITYAEEPICNNFSIKKKKKWQLKTTDRTVFSFFLSFSSSLPLPPLLYGILWLLSNCAVPNLSQNSD